MTKTFKTLEPSKQKRILNAALKEFAEKGYKQASTNQMVKNAGIGKGMLFYYFNSKKELFHYLIQYSLDMTVTEYLDRIDTTESDFIERSKLLSRDKMVFYLKYPDMMNFLGTFILSEEVEIPPELKDRYDEVMQLAYAKIYDHVDKTLFRDDVDPDKAFQLIQWFIDGYQNQILKQLKGRKMSSIDIDPYWDEFYEYLEIMKTSFYKKEGDGK